MAFNNKNLFIIIIVLSNGKNLGTGRHRTLRRPVPKFLEALDKDFPVKIKWFIPFRIFAFIIDIHFCLNKWIFETSMPFINFNYGNMWFIGFNCFFWFAKSEAMKFIFDKWKQEKSLGAKSGKQGQWLFKINFSIKFVSNNW